VVRYTYCRYDTRERHLSRIECLVKDPKHSFFFSFANSLPPVKLFIMAVKFRTRRIMYSTNRKGKEPLPRKEKSKRKRKKLERTKWSTGQIDSSTERNKVPNKPAHACSHPYVSVSLSLCVRVCARARVRLWCCPRWGARVRAYAYRRVRAATRVRVHAIRNVCAARASPSLCGYTND
jgi:hypothetical protein